MVTSEKIPETLYFYSETTIKFFKVADVEIQATLGHGNWIHQAEILMYSTVFGSRNLKQRLRGMMLENGGIRKRFQATSKQLLS